MKMTRKLKWKTFTELCTPRSLLDERGFCRSIKRGNSAAGGRKRLLWTLRLMYGIPTGTPEKAGWRHLRRILFVYSCCSSLSVCVSYANLFLRSSYSSSSSFLSNSSFPRHQSEQRVRLLSVAFRIISLLLIFAKMYASALRLGRQLQYLSF